MPGPDDPGGFDIAAEMDELPTLRSQALCKDRVQVMPGCAVVERVWRNRGRQPEVERERVTLRRADARDRATCGLEILLRAGHAFWHSHLM
ncbi:hypothetical protein JSE7799_03721 [Jannaschia seosinensis]|uniref:Uncharacterized protein n=1 Tax=Jannaschia seosinensis TaxID=313367 RepID=A0A0M7BE32_9RHOB|nr:hypothetical protein JSE7799_03721 [Jannaschia seosinensis]